MKEPEAGKGHVPVPAFIGSIRLQRYFHNLEVDGTVPALFQFGVGAKSQAAGNS